MIVNIECVAVFLPMLLCELDLSNGTISDDDFGGEDDGSFNSMTYALPQSGHITSCSKR